MKAGIPEQLAIAVMAIIVGLSGWLLPYRWNFLRLRRGIDRLFSENVNLLIPKVVGTILILVGTALVVVTVTVGSFE